MRFHLPPGEWSGETLGLSGAEAHHAASVLRVGVGEEVTIFDGAGRVAEAEVVAVSKKEVSLRVTESRHLPPPSTHLTLAVAVPKGQTIEWILEKAVELGASEVIPLLTQRTIVRLAAAERRVRQEKWQRVAIEACKQCGQNWLPKVHAPTPFAEALGALPASGIDLPLVASLEPGSRPLRELVDECVASTRGAPRSAFILIGPEGDLTPDEYAAALAAGFRPVSLGPIVLRVETAALFALSVVGYELRGAGLRPARPAGILPAETD